MLPKLLLLAAEDGLDREERGEGGRRDEGREAGGVDELLAISRSECVREDAERRKGRRKRRTESGSSTNGGSHIYLFLIF